MKRREFLAAAAAAVSAMPVLAIPAGRQEAGGASRRCITRQPRRILILGGTRFLGPAVVRMALAQGHEVTMFNRGLSNPWLFPGVERIVGNRFPEISPGLEPLRNSRWDFVIDVSAQYPRLVEASARLLADRTDHYIMMSSIAVYGDYRRSGITESSPVLRNPPAFKELPDLYETDWQTYGWRKVMCEQAVQDHFGDRCTIVRGGQLLGQTLGGQNKSDGRWYWPARFHRDRVVGAPGDGSDPVQPVDIRDLAAFLIRLGTERIPGTFNAVGPTVRFQDVIETARHVVGSCSEVRWFGSERSRRIFNVPYFTPYVTLPGFSTIANRRAVDAGLEYRALEETIATDWQFFLENMPRDYDFAANGTGLDPAAESALIGS